MDQAYQSIERHPRFPLAAFPSPLQRALRLEAALRTDGLVVPRIYLKRDDLLSLAFGGNKIRNLEFLIGHALSVGATDVLTGGRAQSNHCRLTAAACAKAGLRAHIVLSGKRPESSTGNLLLDELLGAAVHFSGDDDRNTRAAMLDRLREGLQAGARVPYLIPVGGSDGRGALGHVLAAGELATQCDAIGEREFSVALATATGGTQAGMLAGFRQLARKTVMRGFSVAKSAAELRAEVLAIACDVAREIGGPMVSDSDVILDDRALGGGYGAETAEARAAIEILTRTEGVLADPVYTSKGLAGLLMLIRERAFDEGDAVVFLHTGGAPAIFAS